jgi:hypothetical protein
MQPRDRPANARAERRAAEHIGGKVLAPGDA